MNAHRDEFDPIARAARRRRGEVLPPTDATPRFRPLEIDDDEPIRLPGFDQAKKSPHRVSASEGPAPHVSDPKVPDEVEDDPETSIRVAGFEPPTPPTAETAHKAEVARQLDGIGAAMYDVVLVDHAGNRHAYAGRDGESGRMTRDQILDRLGELKELNEAAGYGIEVVPRHERDRFVVVNGVSAESLGRMDEAGHVPAVVQRFGDRHQAVFRLHEDADRDKVADQLTQAYGSSMAMEGVGSLVCVNAEATPIEERRENPLRRLVERFSTGLFAADLSGSRGEEPGFDPERAMKTARQATPEPDVGPRPQFDRNAPDTPDLDGAPPRVFMPPKGAGERGLAYTSPHTPVAEDMDRLTPGTKDASPSMSL